MNETKQISVEQLKSLLEQGKDCVMIDVREHDEVMHGIIPGAKHIPMNEIPEHMDELRKHDEIIFICRSGNRSDRVCQYLNSFGYEGAINMEGGMIAWSVVDGPITSID